MCLEVFRSDAMVGLPRCSGLGILVLLEATFVIYIGSQMSNKSASVGGRQVLDCLSYPDKLSLPYIVQWKKEGVKDPVFIQYDNYPPHMDRSYKLRVKLEERGALELSHIRPEDEGWYECKIILLDGKEDSSVNGSWVHLNVNTPPRIEQSSPNFIQHQQGDTVSLYCDGSGSPPPTISWSKDSRPLRNSLHLRLRGNHVEITNIQHDDGGVYMCTFTNKVGEISQLIKVVIEGGTYISTHPQNKTAIIGQRVSFACAADAYPNNITFTWLHNSIRVVDRDDFPQRIHVEYDGDLHSTLIIPRVDKKDMGLYTCRPSNGISEDKETAAYLNVTYLPRVLPMTSPLFLPLGSPAQIPCDVDSNPPVTRIFWTKNGRDVDFSSPRLTLQPDASLIISPVELSDEGSYSCTPQNNLGQGPSSLMVQVIVRNPPTFVISPLKHYQEHPGDRVTIACAAIGSPLPSITWKKDGEDLTSIDRITQEAGNLTINDLQKSDYGQYECIATNSITSIVRTTTLYIEGTTPHAPRNLSISSGLFHARVSWAPAYDGGSKQHYILWYKNTRSQNSEWQTMPVPDSSTSITIYTLEPDTVYEYYVLSRNAKGNGMPSQVVRAKTLGTDNSSSVLHTDAGYTEGAATALPTQANKATFVPPLVRSIGPQPNPPFDVEAVLVGQRKVKISWKAPVNSTVPVFFYAIQSRQGSGLWQKIHNETIKVNLTSYVWAGVRGGQVHEVRVLALGVLAYSRPSEPVEIFVPNPTPVDRENDSSSNTLQGGVTWPVVGAIIGALAFLLVAILLAVVACLCSKKRERERSNKKYDNVKYTGPNLEDAVMISEDPSKRDQWQPGRGRDSLMSGGVFVVSQLQDDFSDDHGFTSIASMSARSRQLRDSRYGEGYFEGGHQQRQGGRGPSTYPADRETSYSMDSSDPFRDVQGAPRSSLRNTPLYESNLSDRRSSRSMGRAHTSASAEPGRYGMQSGIMPRYDPVDLGITYRSSPGFDGYDGPYHTLHQSDPAPQPASSRPGFPRHSSMKPYSNKTYLTSSPEEDSLHPWRINDISSVLPSSFSEQSRQERLLYPLSSYQDVSSPYNSVLQPRSPFSRQDSGIARPHKPSPVQLPQAADDRHQLGGRATPERGVVLRAPAQRLSQRESALERGLPAGYTRDRLQGAVDKVRRLPRARRGRGPSSRPGSAEYDSYLDGTLSGQPSPSPGVTGPDTADIQSPVFTPRSFGYALDIAPYKSIADNRTSLSSSGRGSSIGRHKPYWEPYRGGHGEAPLPDSFSQSSGLGSRNISQSTGSSFPGRPTKGSNSVSSLATHQEHDLSMDSSPFPEGTGNQRRDISGDENYEFDTVHPTDSDIMESLSEYPSGSSGHLEPGHSSDGPVDLYPNLYPKPRHQSRYSDSEMRFERLREEFQEFRRRQQERMQQSRVSAMDSEML